MKPGSVGPPKLYLGAKVSKIQLPSGVEAYAVSTSHYVQEAVKNVERRLTAKGMRLNRGGTAPLSPGYCPELDSSPELETQDASYYQSLIGILRWMIEMGRIDITCEVSMMSLFVAMPHEGHLQQLLHMFAYLNSHHNALILFNPSYLDIDSDQFPRREWRSLYDEELKEYIPSDAPEPLGMEFILRTYVDTDHDGDRLTRRSQSGMLLFVNSAPIY